ncbi:MAG: hypothetical protein NTW08_00005 [Gammaproteobacteria bacterium]|nr:hypothetical protein [Gammaproteobacteria bacterium]
MLFEKNKSFSIEQLTHKLPSCCATFPLIPPSSTKRKSSMITPQELKPVVSILNQHYWPWVLERIMAIMGAYIKIIAIEPKEKNPLKLINTFLLNIQQSKARALQRWLSERPKSEQVEAAFQDIHAQHERALTQLISDSQTAFRERQASVEASKLERQREIVRMEIQQRKALAAECTQERTDQQEAYLLGVVEIKTQIEKTLAATKKGRDTAIGQEVDGRRVISKAYTAFVNKAEFDHALLRSVATAEKSFLDLQQLESTARTRLCEQSDSKKHPLTKLFLIETEDLSRRELNQAEAVEYDSLHQTYQRGKKALTQQSHFYSNSFFSRPTTPAQFYTIHMAQWIATAPDSLNQRLSLLNRENDATFYQLALEIYRVKALSCVQQSGPCSVCWKKLFVQQLTHNPYAQSDAHSYELILKRRWLNDHEPMINQSYDLFCAQFITPVLQDQIAELIAKLNEPLGRTMRV